MAAQNRPDRVGRNRSAFEKNRLVILATQEICGICGQLVDKSLKSPHPLSPTVDHIIPVAKGGHPSALDNLQLAHRVCNRAKSDKLLIDKHIKELGSEKESNPDMANGLPQHADWASYKVNQ